MNFCFVIVHRKNKNGDTYIHSLLLCRYLVVLGWIFLFTLTKQDKRVKRKLGLGLRAQLTQIL